MPNKSIQLLLKVQDQHTDQMYPGYPFAGSLIIDLNQNKIYFSDMVKSVSLQRGLQMLNDKLLYQALGCKNTVKGNWLTKSEMLSPKDYINSVPLESFYIDCENAVRLYFAINSAIRSHVKGQDTGIIFAIIDEECDYVDCVLFKTRKEVEKYCAQ